MKENQYHGEHVPRKQNNGSVPKRLYGGYENSCHNRAEEGNPHIMLSICNTRTWDWLRCQMYISRIIHCRPSTTIEKYLQEIGRAGRIGANCTALLYFNNNDIAKKPRKGLSEKVIQYCKKF